MARLEAAGPLPGLQDVDRWRRLHTALETPPREAGPADERQEHRCDQCNCAFSTRKKLRQHRARSHGLLTTPDQVQFDPAARAVQGMALCAFCRRTFFSMQALKGHIERRACSQTAESSGLGQVPDPRLPPLLPHSVPPRPRVAARGPLPPPPGPRRPLNRTQLHCVAAGSGGRCPRPGVVHWDRGCGHP